MKNILAFCFFPAFAPPSNGGQARLFNFYKELSEWFNVTLLTSTHIDVSEEVVNHGVRFIERRIPKDHFFSEQWESLSGYSSGGDLSAPCIAACGKYPTLLHQAYLEEYEKADIIIHDFPGTIEYDLFAGFDKKLRVYNAYNCETRLYQRLHDQEKSRPIHEIIQQSELTMLNHADLVLYCSQDDLDDFREIAPNADFQSVYTPNGMSPLFIEESDNRVHGTFSTVFMGSGHPPNVKAAEFIVTSLAPRLPEVYFDIIGSCLPDGKYPTNVRRHGVVIDELKNKILQDANLALNPMLTGSGSNVKVLDYFSCQLPVLSTSYGMRGIDAKAGENYLEATLEQFLDVIVDAIRRPALLETVAAAGNSLAVTKYTWQAIAKSAAREIEELSKKKNKESSARFILAINDYDSFDGVGGGGTRTRGLYTQVCKWNPVIFVCFSNDGTLQKRDYSAGITVISVPKSQEHEQAQHQINSQFHVSVDDIVASRYCLSNPYLTAIYRVVREMARCIVVEHCYMAALPHSFGDRFVYSSQNNETNLKYQILNYHPLASELLPEVKDIERIAVECSAVTIAVSFEDANSLMQGKRTSGPVIVVPNGAATPEVGDAVDEMKDALKEKTKDKSVVFMGSGHMPNVEAAKYIIEQVAPYCREVQFNIIGSVCDALDQTLPNVNLWGVVDDITKSAVLGTCALALNPVLSGSGSNVKLADYLANGLFVVSTEFGRRGYPSSVIEHMVLIPIEQFPAAINKVIERQELFSTEQKRLRRDLFAKELSMDVHAKRFVDTLQSLERKRKRILYVAYRYTSPSQGGAEVNIEKFVRALGDSDRFDIDVVTPEISSMNNHMRFGETYTFDPECSVPIDIPNVRFARFPVNVLDPEVLNSFLIRAWREQPRFERAVSQQLCNDYTDTGFTWGWGDPDGDLGNASRWAFNECGIFLAKVGKLSISGYAPGPAVITARYKSKIIGGPWSVDGDFVIDFRGMAGEVCLSTSAIRHEHEPRPLAFYAKHITLEGKIVELSSDTLVKQHLVTMPAESIFRILDQAAAKSRSVNNVRLTDGRGPWSELLEHFISQHVAEYDLLVTHNNIFRPAVVAIEEANKQSVPSILVPHAHLDDDYYHFPDWLECAQSASLVLTVPKVACDFLDDKKVNVQYLPAGCDTSEEFSEKDRERFQQLHSGTTPFILVLGRKAGAKGYIKIIGAVEQLRRDGLSLDVVLIGPDDDGLSVNSPYAHYYGRQPRSVVRGALMSCVALCNMSTSESFGIVLLEAWLAGKPVIVNRNCAAFHDIAVHGLNSLMVEECDLAEAIHMLVSNNELQTTLADAGMVVARGFDWADVSGQFVNICSALSRKNTTDQLGCE